MFPKLIEGETVSLIGPVASGKTFLMKQWLKDWPRVAVFDPTAEYDDIPGEHFWASPKAFAQRLKDNPNQFTLFYHPQETEVGFTTFASAMWQLLQPRWMFIEEIHELISPWSKHEKMRIIMKYARKRFLGVVGSTQRLADLHKDFTSASRTCILFHTSESNDLKAIDERWGGDAREMVEQLRPLQYDDISESTKQIPQALIIQRGEQPRIEEMIP
jgi:hypothetical protein